MEGKDGLGWVVVMLGNVALRAASEVAACVMALGPTGGFARGRLRGEEHRLRL